MNLVDKENDLKLYATTLEFEQLDGERCKHTIDRISDEIKAKICQLLITRSMKIDERKSDGK